MIDSYFDEFNKTYRDRLSFVVLAMNDKDKNAPLTYNAMTASWGSMGIMWG